MLTKQRLKHAFIFFFLVNTFFISGCATNKYKDGLNASAAYRISDRDILEFNNHVRHMMRLKMKYATIAAYTASTIAIGTATAATVLTAGGAGGLIAIGSLAGASAFSSDIMGIFSFSETTVAYQDGVELMEKAEARYFQALARRTTKGLIHDDTLTIEAANLYSETVGALALVEKALASRIPTMEDVRRATGQVIDDTNSIRTGKSNNLSSITVTPAQVVLKQTEEGKKPSKIINYQGNVPATDTIPVGKNKDIITVTDKTALSAKITGIKGGITSVLVISENGNSTRVNIEVSSPIKITLKVDNGADVEKTKDIIEHNKPKTYKIKSLENITHAAIAPSTANCTTNPNAAIQSLVGKTEGQFTIQCPKNNVYTVTIKNKFETKILTLEVVG